MMDISDIENKVNYCLNCKVKPCSNKGCPLNNDIPAFIQCIKNNNYEEAYKILSNTTVLPGVCGRICPHTKQCQGSCVRGIKGEPVSIGELEALVFDKVVNDETALYNCYKEEMEFNKANNDKKVAIIGGGPAGLSCAAYLARNGIKVTIYEKYDYLGGLLMYGIPEFRLSKDIVRKTISNILHLGIEVQYNREVGKNVKLEELEGKYDAIFLAFGANTSAKMGVKGESLEGVFGGNELLEYNLHPDYTNKKVIVVGGGNVAMDCARTINKLGAKEVSVVYRRAREQMPAEDKEVQDAMDEGVKFLFQNNIVQIKGQNSVEKVELIKTKLVKKEGETREVPINIENSNYNVDVDYIVMALGSQTSEVVYDLGLVLNKWGNILIDENYRTSNNKIFAGGDLAGIKGTVAWAASSGIKAAKSMLEYLKN